MSIAANEQPSASRQSAIRELLTIVVMSAAVVAVYWAPPAPDMTRLSGDYGQLHVRRMQFARDTLFGPQHRLPAWYPRELLGTPFWSNVQNFPFLPTRLLLLTLNPNGRVTYSVAICAAAVLAALFTYLYARKVGLGMIGAAAGGWTFACCGFFAARIAAGHLPLLEVFCALPLLLWATESLVQAQRNGRPTARWIAALAASAMCMALAGHPQLPVYSLAAAVVYALWRGGWKGWPRPIAAMALGVGCAAFALVPMALLIGRSTRILALQTARNDLPMPYRRLLGFFLPWLDGAASPLSRWNSNPFYGYSTPAYFWDTFCYAGLLPWIAVAFLAALLLVPRFCRRITRPAIFIAALGLAGMALSLPIVQQISAHIPGTILRSPARVIYLTEFSVAMALAAAVHLVASGALGNWTRRVLPVALSLHTADVATVNREFLISFPRLPDIESQGIARLMEHLGDARAGIDYNLTLPVNRMVDDVGFFDSVMLAKPYRLLLDLTGVPPDMNVQTLNASQLLPRALQAVGVKFVVTLRSRSDLEHAGSIGAIRVYRVDRPAPRVAFFDMSRVHFLADDHLHAALRDERLDFAAILLLPEDARPANPPPPVSNDPPVVQYRRPDSDHIEFRVTTGRSGYLRVIETWDRGWTATVNGQPAPIVPALDALLAVALPPGQHEVQMVYHTPGARLGIAASLCCVTVLGIWLYGAARGIRGQAPTPPMPSAAL